MWGGMVCKGCRGNGGTRVKDRGLIVRADMTGAAVRVVSGAGVGVVVVVVVVVVGIRVVSVEVVGVEWGV